VFVCWLIGWFVRSFVGSLICVGAKYRISKMVGDRGSVPMDHQQEMAYGESIRMITCSRDPTDSAGPLPLAAWRRLRIALYESFSSYRVMDFSAKRGLAIACHPSVCLSVSDVGGGL